MSNLKIAWTPEYVHPVPVGHKFPMEKYDLLPKQLVHQGICEEVQFFAPELLSDHYAEMVHDAAYLHRFKNNQLSKREQRVTGFEHSPLLIEREYKIAEGTRLGVDFALSNGAAANIAGGTHHAYSDRGEGFCMLNDLAIAAAYALKERGQGKILVLDLDVHQGNGTAQIFENTQEVFTLSLHGQHNYPLRKENSSLDIPLPQSTGDSEYLLALNAALKKVETQFGSPDLILYQAGVDVLASDKLGQMRLSLEGVRKREQRVVQYALDMQAPLVFTMGGGYSPNITSILNAHTFIFEEVSLRFF